MKKSILVSAIIFMFCVTVYAALIDGGTSTEGEAVKFAWDANIESDLAGYRIYASSQQGVYSYGSENAMVEIPCNGGDTSSLCTTWQTDSLPIGTWYFVITAYDLAGNESGPSVDELKKTVVAYNAPPSPPTNWRFDVTP